MVQSLIQWHAVCSDGWAEGNAWAHPMKRSVQFNGGMKGMGYVNNTMGRSNDSGRAGGNHGLNHPFLRHKILEWGNCMGSINSRLRHDM